MSTAEQVARLIFERWDGKDPEELIKDMALSLIHI